MPDTRFHNAVNVTGHRITNLADGTEDTDAVNRSQLEAAFEGIGAVTSAGALTTRFEPMTNGDPMAPELIFDENGDVMMIEVPN